MFASLLEALHEILDGLRLVPLRLIGRSKLESIHDVVPTPFLTDTAGDTWQHDIPHECTARIEVRASGYMSAGVPRPSPLPSPGGRGRKAPGSGSRRDRNRLTIA